MSNFRIEKIKIPCAEFNGVSSLPSVSEKLRLSFMKDVFELDEYDGLYINYGMVDYAFPYKTQDNYTRELHDKEHLAVVLENEYLKATFLPQFGGKLHSLFDKKEQKELLFVNSVLRPCHLAIRNAWMSGGIEWNCGYVGHHPFTCDLTHTAKTFLDDGTPVLRFYQFERIRSVIYQLDFFLPEGSKLLYVRTKIINPHFNVVPMYWWSNVAVPDIKGGRVITPVNDTFSSRASHPVKLPVPVYNNIDITYPSDNIISIDYFWNIPVKERKFICHVDKNGYGLVQTSTDRLKGRKLFVWGDSAGGDRWKNFLTADNESGSYCEIQSGLAQTQYECLPMPPKTVWEWVEAYGAVSLNPKKAHGTWNEAKEEAKEALDNIVTEENLEKLLLKTRDMSKRPAEEMILRGDGWGALEEKRREFCGEAPMCSYLDFGKLTDEQEPWLKLLNEGTLGTYCPQDEIESYMYQSEWTSLLKSAVKEKDKENWLTWLHLGLATFAEKNYEKAEEYLKKSLEFAMSPWALYALAILKRDCGLHEEEVSYMLKALNLLSDDLSLTKAAFRCLYENSKLKELKDIYENLPEKLQNVPRLMAYYGFSLAGTGNIEEAEKILYRNGGLIVPDIREGETITLDLWLKIEKAKAKREGTVFDESAQSPPYFTDFRMFANTDWLNGK